MNVFKHSSNHSDENPIPEIPHRRGVQKATDAGERALWTVFAIFAVSTIVFALTTVRVQVKNRLFGLITTFITLFAAISYFAMATGGGGTFVRAPGHHAVRELYYARYIDWSVTTPLLVLDLALLAGLSPIDTVLTIVADVGMIVTGLFAAMDNDSRSRWGYYAFSCLFFLWVLYNLIITGTSTAKLRGNRVSSAYITLSIFTAILWTAYPIVWAFAEGTNYISVDTEIYIYAVLDVLAKSGFGFGLLFAHSSIAEAHISLPNSLTDPIASGGYGAISLPDDS